MSAIVNKIVIQNAKSNVAFSTIFVAKNLKAQLLLAYVIGGMY